MNLDSYYDQIIKDLGDEKRPRVNLACNEKTELIQLFESLSESELKSNLDEFKKVLCIVCHLSAPSSEFQEGFNRLLVNKKLPKSLFPKSSRNRPPLFRLQTNKWRAIKLKFFNLAEVIYFKY